MTIPLLGGFAGIARINGVQLLLTSGNAALENTQTFVTLMDIVPDNSQRTKILYAPGTTIINGSLAWDVHAHTMDLISTNGLLKRGSYFTVQMWTGNIGAQFAGKSIDGAYVSSLSLQGSVGGLISANMSFVSAAVNENMGVWNDWDGHGFGSYISTRSDAPSSNMPYGYWYSGNPNIPVRDWSLSYSQEVTPVFLNQNSVYPRYMKCGTEEVTLDLTTMEQINPNTNINDLSSVMIATKTFVIEGAIKSQGFTFNGPTEAGTYSYSFSSASLNMRPAKNIITS